VLAARGSIDLPLAFGTATRRRIEVWAVMAVRAAKAALTPVWRRFLPGAIPEEKGA